MTLTCDDKAIILGHPSYGWGFGQTRRLNMIRRFVSLEGKATLDIGCGIGTYLRQLQRFSPLIYGIEMDRERAHQAAESLPYIVVAQGERLPFRDEVFDVALLHEVIEHVGDDGQTIREAFRVVREGGHIVVFAPNRWYPFETHGFYLGKRYIFKLAPLLNYLPNRLRRWFVPHVRAYSVSDLKRLWKGLNLATVVHTQVYPGFDRLCAQRPGLGRLVRRVCYFLEQTPFRAFGLSHFVVLQKTLVS